MRTLTEGFVALGLIAVIALLFFLVWLVTTQDRRIGDLERDKRKAQADDWDDQTTVYSHKGVPEMNRIPWRIRALWWWDRQRERVARWFM